MQTHQYSCLGNLRTEEPGRLTVRAKSQTEDHTHAMRKVHFFLLYPQSKPMGSVVPFQHAISAMFCLLDEKKKGMHIKVSRVDSP